MSVPIVPGFMGPRGANTLDTLWSRPAGVPDPLWPTAALRRVTPAPTDWLTVASNYFNDDEHGGVNTVLVQPDDVPQALAGTSWLGHHLGDVGIWDDGTFEDGLTEVGGAVTVEFLIQGRRAAGATVPAIEVAHPFIWYWDAFPVRGGWRYLNRAGRDQDLIRYTVTDDEWKVEVRALELRQFLAARGRAAVVQLDIVPKAALDEFERVDDEFRNEWSHFTFHALHDLPLPGDKPAFSRLLGRYVVTGTRGSRVPRFEERRQDREYPTFIYGVDAETGTPLTHTCDPDQLGTYFDKDNSRLHYLTPTYFKPAVLQPYQAEPHRYQITATRLSCLNLWGVDISFNTAGLVEVYLGDLGRDLPSDEWGHWRTYNVPPEGQMDEGRFRRDFLNQFASSRDPAGDLRRARAAAADASARLLGTPLWKPLSGETSAEWESLLGPLTEDPAALGPPLLLLTKALVDGIDPMPLKKYLGSHEPGEQSLRLLERFVIKVGGSGDDVAILRALQGFRSRGGVAHLAGSKKAAAAADLGIADLSIIQAFESIAVRTTAALQVITRLMDVADGTSRPEAT